MTESDSILTAKVKARLAKLAGAAENHEEFIEMAYGRFPEGENDAEFKALVEDEEFYDDES